EQVSLLHGLTREVGPQLRQGLLGELHDAKVNRTVVAAGVCPRVVKGVPRPIPSLRKAFVRERPGRAIRCKSSLAKPRSGLSASIPHANAHIEKDVPALITE